MNRDFAEMLAAESKAPFLSREDLIRNKRATGRTKDLADAEEIEKLDPP